MNLLITGGAGFIGSNFVRLQRQRYPQDRVVVLDALTYAGNLHSLADLDGDPGMTFVRGDIGDRALVDRLLRDFPADEPLFLFVHLWDVHYDYRPPESYWRRFDPDYAGAFDTFRQSYVEQLWISHLHMAYTLPFLDRAKEGAAHVTTLLKMRPAFTIREADAYYKMWCFAPSYREKMCEALRMAALPE
mgnify:CR=1 FL=1